MAIAGIRREGQINHPPAFTMLTTVPGEDVVSKLPSESCLEVRGCSRDR
jgi:hypothetical protein